MRILALIAHPDYLGQCFSGTVANHTRRGDDVYVVSLTPGELGIATILYSDRSRAECAAIKTQELANAAQVLGVKGVQVLNFPDGELQNTPELRLAVAQAIRQFTPDVLISHWPHDAHPDLRIAGQASLDACLTASLAHIELLYPPHAVKRVFTFALPSAIDFAPTLFVNITEVVDAKRQAMTCYPTILAELHTLYAGKDSDDWMNVVLAPNMFWGQESGVLYAEAFKEVKVPGLPRRAIRHLPLS
ncbi:MAG: PIG-L deacetylase family protein [Anaerolineae bacterium]|nr:PIG-L family deacetylase [Candidatus Roseilinea sp.]MDW8450073.1 PIG-L deacetylase family protein [Anaerolineae bacterium]